MTGFNLLYAAYSEGSVYCHVEHPINYMVNNVTFHLRQPYHLLMARGPTSGSKRLTQDLDLKSSFSSV